MNKPLLTLDEAAEYLGVPKAGLKSAAKAHGFIVQMGRAQRLERDRLGELIEKCRDQPKEHASTSSNTVRTGTSGTPASPTAQRAAQAAQKLKKPLAAYIATKGREGLANEPENVSCGEVLAIYAEEYAPTVSSPERIGYAISALLPFWSELKLTHVKGETCRRYAAWRERSAGTVRRELGTLQAAMNYAHREGFVTSAPVVTLPQKPEPRERWLTRAEAARLLWAAYRGHKTKHLARFILIALYTGTRKDAILRMGFEPNTVGGWFDLDRGIMYRKSEAERSTKKRRTPAPIPRQLQAHLRRWRDSGCRWAVEYEGARAGDVKRSFARIATDAKLTGVTPHTLKHTAITWALQNGATIWDAAGFFANSADTIERTYGHHSPSYQATALQAAERRK